MPASLAEDAGFDGLWLYDHLAGSVHGAPHVLECWTVLERAGRGGAAPHARLAGAQRRQP